MLGSRLSAPGFISKRYVLRREIGRGGMGIVYEAYDRLTGGMVALKSIPVDAGSRPAGASLPTRTQTLDSVALSPESAAPSLPAQLAAEADSSPGQLDPRASGQRFLLAVRTGIIQEFRILATVRHPYIISVLDYGLDGAGDPFFTMELLAQDSQLRVAARDTPLSTRVLLLAQIARALIYLHRRGILHRDLKPAKVTIERTR